MKQYWFDIFDAATTSDGSHLIEPLRYQVIREYFGPEASAAFVQWFVARRHQIGGGI